MNWKEEEKMDTTSGKTDHYKAKGESRDGTYSQNSSPKDHRCIDLPLKLKRGMRKGHSVEEAGNAKKKHRQLSGPKRTKFFDRTTQTDALNIKVAP